MKRLCTAFTVVLLLVTAVGYGDEEKPTTLTLVWPDGTKYIGGVIDGERNGEGTIYWTDGTKFIGQFKNDLRNGPGSMFLPDGTVHSGYFVNDKLVDLPDEQTATPQTADTGQQTVKPVRDGLKTGDRVTQSVASKQQTKEPAGRAEKPASDQQIALVTKAQQTVQHVPITRLSDNIRRALTYTIDLWAAAWSTQNTELYLDIYHKDFKVPSELTRRQWQMLRKSRLKKPKSIDVAIAYHRFEIIKPDTAEVTFKQTYKSNLYRDVTTKVLTLAYTADGWKIILESAQ